MFNLASLTVTTGTIKSETVYAKFIKMDVSKIIIKEEMNFKFALITETERESLSSDTEEEQIEEDQIKGSVYLNMDV